MSGPTKGMVAGQAIVTNAQTKEFDEGYERIFGKDRKPQRGHWVLDSGTRELVDGEGDSIARVPILTDRYMEGVQAQDGADISSRTKRREYMKANSLCDADDISPQYRARRQAEEKRADSKALRETIARATYLKTKPKGPQSYE